MPLDRDAYLHHRAHVFWIEDGKPDGRADEHWERALGELEEPPKRWKFIPSADADDDRWLGGPIWRSVTVVARTAGEARFLASEWEAEKLGHSPTADTAGGTTMSYQSALADPVLYHLEEIAGGEGLDLGVEGEPNPLKAPEGGWHG